MSRPLRIEYPNAWYHVMNRGRRHEKVFQTKQDYYTFIRCLKEASELFGLHISAYCLMPNHYHLLVQTPHANLSRCMRHINGVYTQRFNRLHDYDGGLFRGRYKAIVVEGDEYLLQVLRYIHQNPIKANLVKKMDDYPWSSHHGYSSKADKWRWLHKKELLDMLEGNKSKQLSTYSKFIIQNLPEEIELFYLRKNLSPLLGGKTFIDRVKASLTTKHKEPEIAEAKNLAITSDIILKAISLKFEISVNEIIYPKRGGNTFPRDLGMYLIKLFRMDSLQTIATDFGDIHYSTVSNSIARAKKRIAENQDHYQTMVDIKETIRNWQGKT